MFNMSPEQAAAEYIRLATLASATEWGSDEWKAAVRFAHTVEENSTEESFDAYLNAIEASETRAESQPATEESPMSHKVKTARPVAAAFGLFWTNPKGQVVPCEAYTINSDGRTTSGDDESDEKLAAAFERGDTFLIYESYLNEADAARSASDHGQAYSVRPLPAGTFFYDGETLCVVAPAEPTKARLVDVVPAPAILQVWKRADLGAGWTVSFLSDGSASFYNATTNQDLRLPKYSIDTLRKLAVRDHAENLNR